MSDPTLSEMREFLKEEFPYADEFTTEPAIWWFACDYHGGQSSNLYEALCASEYQPGRSERKCPEDCEEQFTALVDKFERGESRCAQQR